MSNYRVDPLPDSMLPLIDYSRIALAVGPWLAEDPVLADNLDRLSWMAEGFDDYGMMSVSVTNNVTGEVVAGASCHWSALVPPEAGA